MSFYGIFASSIIICAIALAFAMSENAQMQGYISSTYISFSANIHLQSLSQIIANAAPGNISVQNIAQLNHANLSCAGGQCTVETPYGYFLIKN